MTRPRRSIRDATLTASIALPAADGSVYTASFDLGAAPANRDFEAAVEALITAPALGATPLPNDDTMTYKLQHSTDDSTFSTLYDAVLVQLGAGGVGAAAATARAKLPSDCYRYIRLAATGAGTIGDCSGSSCTLELLF